MHELSIAQNIFEIIKQNVPHEELRNVRAITLKLGEFSGVVPDSLRFSFEAVTSSTQLQGSALEIEIIPFKLRCSDCHEESANEFGMRLCKSCGSLNTEILSGTEMQINEIKLETNSEVI